MAPAVLSYIPVETLSFGARMPNTILLCLSVKYSTAYELEPWRGGKTYMLTRGWILNYSRLLPRSHGLPREPGWSRETKKHHFQRMTALLF